jgi:hypothetical protein
MYSELVYFEGAHFAHIALWVERNRLQAIRARALDHHGGSRGNGRRFERYPDQSRPAV